MYYKRRKSGPNLLSIIVLGLIAGGLFLVYEKFQDVVPAPAVSAPSPAQTTGQTLDSAPAAAPVSASSDLNESAAAELAPDIAPNTTLFIPSAGIFANIVQVYLDGSSWDVSHLGMNVGHLEGTSWLDERGNVVLSGHVELSDGRKGVFGNLDELQIGDPIIVQEGGLEYRYTITNIGQTTPDDLTPIYPTTSSQLTLITCGSYDFLQDSYLERTVITAQLESTVTIAPQG